MIGEQQERMIEALSVLARSKRGLESRVLFDLRAPVADVLAARGTEIARRRLKLESNLESGLV